MAGNQGKNGMPSSVPASQVTQDALKYMGNERARAASEQAAKSYASTRPAPYDPDNSPLYSYGDRHDYADGMDGEQALAELKGLFGDSRYWKGPLAGLFTSDPMSLVRKWYDAGYFDKVKRAQDLTSKAVEYYNQGHIDDLSRGEAMFLQALSPNFNLVSLPGMVEPMPGLVDPAHLELPERLGYVHLDGSKGDSKIVKKTGKAAMKAEGSTKDLTPYELQETLDGDGGAALETGSQALDRIGVSASTAVKEYGELWNHYILLMAQAKAAMKSYEPRNNPEWSSHPFAIGPVQDPEQLPDTPQTKEVKLLWADACSKVNPVATRLNAMTDLLSAIIREGGTRAISVLEGLKTAELRHYPVKVADIDAKMKELGVKPEDAQKMIELAAQTGKEY